MDVSSSPIPTAYFDFEPDYASAPGALLDEVLRKLDLTQADLADRTGLSTKYVNQIIKKNVTLSAETAVRLEAVTSVPAETWTRLEADFRASGARAERQETLKAWTPWLSNFRLPELKHRGLISASTSSADTVEELLRYFGISSPASWDRVWQPSLTRFRRSPSFTPETPPTTVWLRIGQKKAAAMETLPFNARRLTEMLPSIRTLTRSEPSAALAELPKMCAQVGVAVVYATELKGCRASGATWWANPEKAVVLLSNRGKREDRLWFSLFHEFGHILKHAKRDTYLDQTGPDSDRPPWEDLPPASGFIDDGSRDSMVEREADDFASSALIPTSALVRLRAVNSEDAVRSLADDLNIAPGVVAGRWQYERSDFTKFNSLRRELPAEPFDASP